MDILQFQKQASELFHEKNLLYGRNNVSVPDVVARLEDKMSRIKNMLHVGSDEHGSIHDACIDISNYCFILDSLTDGSWYSGIDRTKANYVGVVSAPQKEGDVGYDLSAAESVMLYPGETMSIDTGVRILSPKSTWYSIKARSSISKRGLLVLDNVIDTEYTGPLLVLMHNISKEEQKIPAGCRIAQIVFFRSVCPEMVQVEMLPKTGRGDSGWGSTGQ